MGIDNIIPVNLTESHWRKTILDLSRYAATLTPGSPQHAIAQRHASVIQAALGRVD